eukprot:6463713-Prymnesium_polylepis.1
MIRQSIDRRILSKFWQACWLLKNERRQVGQEQLIRTRRRRMSAPIVLKLSVCVLTERDGSAESSRIERAVE